MAGKHAAHNGPSSSGSPRPAIILAGRITDVDPLRWTCIVHTEEGGPNNSRTLYDIPLGGPYLHPVGGEGILVMPEIGALVEVCKPSEGDAQPFIVSYRPYSSRDAKTTTDQNKPSASGNRPRLNPGDMAIVTRDRNGIFMRRGQVTEILGGPLARTYFLGRTGTVHTICQVAKLDTFAGSLRWEVDRPEKDADGHQATRMDAKLKEYADDRSYVARLQVGGALEAPVEGEPNGETGAHGGAPDALELVTAPVVRLRIFTDGDKEEQNLTAAASLCFSKTGEMEIALKDTLHVAIRGSKDVTLAFKPDGTVSLTAESDVEVESGGTVRVKAGTLEVTQSSAGVEVGLGTAAVLFDLGFSAKLAAALTEAAAVATANALPAINMTSFVTELLAGNFTSKKLTTE